MDLEHSFVNKSIEENGEGLTGIVLGSEDLEETRDQLLEQGIDFGNISLGEGKDFDSGKIRRWKNLFLPDNLTRGLFSFLIEHTEGDFCYGAREASASSVHKLGPCCDQYK